MMLNHLVTIIMPAYNAERTISKAINSVLKQDYSNFELIVVNDGSTDNTKSVCSQFSDKRIKVITQENKGLSGARNTGLLNSNGDFVTFVDSDDWIDHNFISLLLEGLLNNEASLAICGMVKEYPSHKQYLSFEKSSTFYDCLNNEAFLKLFEGGLINSCCNKLYKKSIIDNNCLSFSGKTLVEDIEFNLHYINYSESICTLKSCLYHYIMAENSLTSFVSEDMIQNYISIQSLFLNLLSDDNKVIAHKFTYHQYLSIFLKYLYKVSKNEISKEKAFSILNKYLKEPLVQFSFKSSTPTNYKNLFIHICFQKKFFYILLAYIIWKSKI